ncbi:GPI biosynthesis protein Pig-F [Ophiocordyceps camponoti-floridani]|uniref:GPI biosynthesis protein Pig-F n=1 Tax=Ophiocordyceps camponoti-floridani TaxID=2030778 RepID=A0A8H4QDQ4_9HYPO|nr:GPI biosynthesis protein Pig-F [Ophiocordyceps camponoti-floridani]
MSSAIPPSNRASQPPSSGTNPASPPNRRDLKSWWKNFKLPSKHQEPSPAKAPGIFGVPLRQSITYANVAISLIDERGQSYIYGYVPIVVAKCGVYLKEKATGVEGIFRLSGSEKRIKELKSIFDSPDRYGKGLVWDGYTVHDAANVLRRYLNDLPEPVVPLDLYEKFRDPLRGATKLAVGDIEGPQFVDSFDEKAAIARYQKLITELPPLNRQLLLYILDLLAVFAAKADENRMNSQNLAAIFQPGMLSHPTHAMAPEEYRLNQCVLIFLIENQDHFLIGMQGTAADEKTMKEVASGTPSGPQTPNLNVVGPSLDRSPSNASAGATSVRRDGKIRRNRSVSSRHSRQEGSATPTSPSLAATPTGGLGRSNTVPSKKSPALGGAKLKKNDGAAQQSPGALVEPMTPVRPAQTINTRSSPTANLTGVSAASSGLSQERLLETQQETPRERNLPSLFQRSPTEGVEKRQPNKLKKKRLAGGLNASAQSSSASLVHSNAASPTVEATEPMESMDPILEPLSQPSSPTSARHVTQHTDGQRVDAKLAPPDPEPAQKSHSLERSSQPTPRPSYAAANTTLHPEDVRGARSPPISVHSSSFNEGSDLDLGVDDQPTPMADISDKEKKRRWRLSRSRKEDNGGSSSSAATPPQPALGSNDKAEISNTSIGSGASKQRDSGTNDSSEPTTLASVEGQGGHETTKEDAKGPLGWIRSKYREAKESAEHRRNKSPSTERQASRGKSVDLKRDKAEDNREASARRGRRASSPRGNLGERSAGAPHKAETTAAAPPKTETLAEALASSPTTTEELRGTKPRTDTSQTMDAQAQTEQRKRS